MTKRFILILTAILALSITNNSFGQITLPEPPYVPGQTITAAALNNNLSTLASTALNRTGGTMTGGLTGTSISLSSTLAVTGAVTLNSTLAVTGTTTLGVVTTAALTASGHVIPATGATYNSGASATRWLTVFTGALDASGDILDSTGNVTINDALDVSGAVTLSSTIAVTGNVTLSALLTASGSTAGGRQHTLINTSNGTSSFIDLRLQNDAGNSAAFQYLSSTFTGLNNAFLISNTGNGIIRFVTAGGFEFTSGRVNTNTSQPGFLCVRDTTTSALGTGDQTIPCTEVYDHAGNFASDVFTAPVTGTYALCANIQGTTTGITFLEIKTSNRDYVVHHTSGASTVMAGNCVHADMDASDTARMNAEVSSGTFTANPSSIAGFIYFSGRLVL